MSSTNGRPILLALDVPQEVCDLANMIDWSRVSEDDAKRRLKDLEAFIGQHLPKGKPLPQRTGAGKQRVRTDVPQWVWDIVNQFDYSGLGTIRRAALKAAAVQWLRANGVPLR
jgi:hypothetical protein